MWRSSLHKLILNNLTETWGFGKKLKKTTEITVINDPTDQKIVYYVQTTGRSSNLKIIAIA